MNHTHGSRRCARLLAVLLAATGLLQSSVMPTHALYSESCEYEPRAGDPPNETSWARIARERTEGILGVIGQVRARHLYACSPVSGGTNFGLDYDVPWVLPVTLLFRKDPVASGGRAVQLGYGKCGRSPSAGNCPSMPNDGKLHFAYTSSDSNEGAMSLATWYTNADGTRKDPTVGHEYRMKVEEVTVSGAPKWRYCIRDVTEGESYQCHDRSRTWPSAGQWAWWLAETNNPDSVIGVIEVDPHINMRWMQFELGTQGNWWVLGGLSGCAKVNQGLGGTATEWPPYYECGIASTADIDGDGLVNDQETLRVWTDGH